MSAHDEARYSQSERSRSDRIGGTKHNRCGESGTGLTLFNGNGRLALTTVDVSQSFLAHKPREVHHAWRTR